MPNHNHAREMRDSLADVTSQSRPAHEIVVVDDGSTDDSLDVIAGFEARTPTMRVLRHSQRRGVAAAINTGLGAATGEFVILVSADERVSHDLCREMTSALAVHPHARLIVARFTEWFPETGVLRHGEGDECDLWFVAGDAPVWISPAEFERLLGRRHVRLSVNSAMFARATLVEMGMFDPALMWHSDWFLIYATALRHGFCAHPRVVSWFRISASSYSATGAASRTKQRALVDNLLAKLDRSEFEDVREALLRSPSAMSPFMRPLLLALAASPRRYRDLGRIARWWGHEVALGRRPRWWASSPAGDILRRLASAR